MNYQRNVYYSPVAPHKPRYYVGKNKKLTAKMLAQLLLEAEKESNIGFDAEPLPEKGMSRLHLRLTWLSIGLLSGSFWFFIIYKIFA